TPEAAKALSLEELEAFLKAQRYSARTGRLPHIYAALQKPMPRALTPEAYVVRLNALIPILRTIYHQRTYAEKQMLTLFKQHPDAGWWASLPGAGPLTAPRLLAYIGD